MHSSIWNFIKNYETLKFNEIQRYLTDFRLEFILEIFQDEISRFLTI